MMFIELFREDIDYIKKIQWKKALGIAFLIIQLLQIVHARFISERYFCWAPHDMQTEFELTVYVNGQELSPHEIYQRFQMDKKDRNSRAAANVKDIIIQHSRTYGK